MAARKTKLTGDWIVTTGHGSEAGADPAYVSVGFPNNICVEKYFT